MHRSLATFTLVFASGLSSIANAQEASTDSAQLASLASGPSDALPAADAASSWETAPATRRSGFTLGTSFGLMGGASHGYPNKIGQVGNPAYRAETAGLGGGGFLWLGGALADWFTFGIGGGGANLADGETQWSGGAFLFHLEAFPLFSVGDAWRDVGLSFDIGTGPGSIVRKADKEEVSGDGFLSLVGMGVFWESWRVAGGHLTAGPALNVMYGFSEWQKTTFGMLGLRGAFYGGP